MTQDAAAIRSLEENQMMAQNPRTVLENRHAAPLSNSQDPSNSDIDAKAALDAAAMTEQWEAENAKKAEDELAARKDIAESSDRGVEPGKTADLDGAHKAFISDNIDLDDDALAAKAEQAKTFGSADAPVTGPAVDEPVAPVDEPAPIVLPEEQGPVVEEPVVSAEPVVSPQSY